MRNETGMPHGDRREAEAAAVIDHAAVHQMRHWVAAHMLNACRVCTGFRIAELIAAPDSDWSRRQGRADGSGPSFARR